MKNNRRNEAQETYHNMSEPLQNMENQINKSEKAIHCLILLLNAQK